MTRPVSDKSVRTTCPRCGTALVVDVGDLHELSICGMCQEVFVANADRGTAVSREQREEWEENPDWPRRRRSRIPGGEAMAAASLVMAIFSLLIFCVWPVGLPVSFVGIVLGAAGLRTRSRRIAVTGLVLSTVGLIFSTGFAVVTIAGVMKAEYDRPSPTNPRMPVFKGKQ